MLLMTINPHDPLGPLQVWYKDTEGMVLLGTILGTDSPLSIHYKGREAA
jgi:hypothetical protein